MTIPTIDPFFSYMRGFLQIANPIAQEEDEPVDRENYARRAYRINFIALALRRGMVSCSMAGLLGLPNPLGVAACTVTVGLTLDALVAIWMWVGGKPPSERWHIASLWGLGCVTGREVHAYALSCFGTMSLSTLTFMNSFWYFSGFTSVCILTEEILRDYFNI